MPDNLHRKYDLLIIEFFNTFVSGKSNGTWESFLKEKGPIH